MSPFNGAPQDIAGDSRTVAPLDSVISTAELSRRPSRPPDHASENRALVALARAMAGSPDDVLQKLAETALDLCRAHSAGLSIVEEEDGRKIFRWRAAAGQWAPLLRGTMPREFSPCGTVLDRNASQLMIRPERHFTPLLGVTPRIEELLLIPFDVAGETVGTIWVMAHDESLEFDMEDLRVMGRLGDFAAACLTLDSLNVAARAHQAEAALRESEQRFAAIFKQAAGGIARVDLTGRYTLVNDRYCQIVDRSREDLLGLRLQDLTHSDDLSRNVDLIRAAIEEGDAFRIEKRYLRPDGSTVWVSNDVSAIRDESGRPTGVMAVCQDITERRRTERLLIEQSRLLEMIASGAPVGECLSAICTAVPRLCARVRASILLADTERRTFPRSVAPDLLPSFGQGLKDAPIDDQCVGTCGEAVFRGESVACSAIADDEKWSRGWRDLCMASGVFACYSNPIPGTDGFPVGSFMLCFDEPREPSDWDHRVSGFGIHVASIAIARDRAVDALREANRRKDEFLATLAHELRNPLAPIAHSLEVMKRAGGDRALLERSRDTMDRQIAQLVRLVDDLLDVSRISRGRIELRRERIELASTVRQAVDTCRREIEGRNQHLTTTLPDEPLHLHADPIRLSQVVANLLSNASRFSPEGGEIWLSAEAANEERGAADWAVLSIRDNGSGIDADALPHVFEMFMQSDRSRERSQGGLGVGLTLVQRLVELHGGTVEARSAGAGQGSELIVRLPALPDDGAVGQGELEKGPGAEEITSIRRRRILVVDDNRDAADTLGTLLSLMGNEVQTAYDGVEAIETVASFRPDAVLLDIGMPKLNGYDAADRIRKQPEGRDIVLIALTGWGQERDILRSRHAGFDGHLVKPVDHGVLLDLLDDLPARPSAAGDGG